MKLNQPFAGLVLAAGKGSRFQSESGEPLPKVLRPLLGRPLVMYVLDTLMQAGVKDITLVVGYRSGDVKNALGNLVDYALQEEQKGSGHAVLCARDNFFGFNGHLIIMCGDSPLFTADTVRKMMKEHLQTGAAITLASAMLDDPYGYGRIVRDSEKRIKGVVEEKCADEGQRTIHEVNGGAYISDAQWLFANIDQMALNDADEYNLTDMVRVAVEQNRVIAAVECDERELLGVNTPDQLRAVEEMLGGKI